MKDFDYSESGEYFVTICTKNKKSWFGTVRDSFMVLNDVGKIVNKCWQEIPLHFPNVELDDYVIMPNHIHGIISIVDNQSVGAENFLPLRCNRYQKIIPRSLGCIIKGFKIGVTKWCRTNNREKFHWQRSYYEHIVRNKKDLERIRKYILDNPYYWFCDQNNPNF